ncbi:MAG: hypothetical protein C4551_00665 [Bacillota bacterium]|nr:MAG: hypothetical protein C4551_00665 [Bacillota bacterium]
MNGSAAWAQTASPTDFWLGLYLILFSGGYLSLVLDLGQYGTSLALTGALLWVTIGAALFISGSLVFTRGLETPAAKTALAVTAALYGVRVLLGGFILTNPFAGGQPPLATLSAGLGAVADLGVAAAAAWMLLAVFRPRANLEKSFGLAGLAFLAAFVFQVGVAPFIQLLLFLVADPGSLAALGTSSGLAFTARLLPSVARGVAGLVALWALWLTARRWELLRPQAWALGLWGVADLLFIVALWVSWSGPVVAVSPPPMVQVRTSLFIGLLAIALFGLASVFWRRTSARP